MPSTPRCIAVQTATEQYDIHIGAGALAQLGQQARAWNKGKKAFVLTHPSLYELYGGRLSESLRRPTTRSSRVWCRRGNAARRCGTPPGCSPGWRAWAPTGKA